MTTEYVDHLSDVDLHKKLMQYGFPNTPVTETTRQILIKKLKNHMKQEHYTSDLSPTNLPQSQYNSKRDKFLISPQWKTSQCNSKKNNSNQDFIKSFETIGLTTYSSSPKMYAPPPILTLESESEGEHTFAYNNYRNMCSKSLSDSSNHIISNGFNFDNSLDTGVVNRLLSLRGSTLQRKYKEKIYSAEDKKSANKLGHLWSPLTNFRTHIKSRPHFKAVHIPYLLIGVLLIFFIVITLIYMSRRFEQDSIDQKSTLFDLCNESEHLPISNYKDQYKIMCIASDLLKSALDINREIKNLLEERSLRHYCVDKNQNDIVQYSEIIRILQSSRRHLSYENFHKELSAAIHLIERNPQWKIRTIHGLDESFHGTLSIDTNIENIYFVLSKPSLPFKCVLLNKIQRFFIILGSLAVFGLIFLIGQFSVQYIRKRSKKRLLAVDQIINDIIGEIVNQTKQTENGQISEIAICQLYEKIIPVNKRRQLQWSWNEALRQLEENDKRLLFGVILRNGKEIKTISWNEGEQSDLINKKKWQSPAFDNSNRITNPPTSCLKIRHMFDSSEVNQPNLKQLIIDAIFEKVGTQCKICDIQLDKQSCCVYLRCVSEQDAGIVHNKINGWWFDKRLISIKFLRLERYISRFPKSSNQPICFLSSNLIKVHQR